MKEIPIGTSGRSAMEVAREIALEAGIILVERFHKAKQITVKGRGDIVTDVDTFIESKILNSLSKEFPGANLLGEESSGPNFDTGYVWIIDPIDGTRNYASGIPFFSLVIGLVLDGEVLLGINYDPLRKEMFHAEKGKGAFLNDKRLKVTEKRSIDESIIGSDLSYNDQGAANTMDVIFSLWPGMQTARIMGSAALGISYVAAGRTDLYFHHKLQPWDQVAGIILVQEAGGIITDRNGRDISVSSDGLIASNEKIHSLFLHKTTGLKWRDPN